ncbi:Guanine nucleotide-binding protein-like 3 homolog (Nucleostemin-1) [Durusdinium trenchii]|uniref:Guanine nucleotide-binding protein-like 3 homolog (Nucleostemin-1) n=1 Tax=Durusdinium trenchii TaxID=1381693 RepID=A0ABP0SG05_9DINO
MTGRKTTSNGEGPPRVLEALFWALALTGADWGTQVIVWLPALAWNLLDEDSTWHSMLTAQHLDFGSVEEAERFFDKLRREEKPRVFHALVDVERTSEHRTAPCLSHWDQLEQHALKVEEHFERWTDDSTPISPSPKKLAEQGAWGFLLHVEQEVRGRQTESLARGKFDSETQAQHPFEKTVLSRGHLIQVLQDNPSGSLGLPVRSSAELGVRGMVKKKRQSKRTSLKDKYKMERKVKEHHRKARREARKAAREGRSRKPKKDPGLPNLMPYKEKFLRQMMDDKEREQFREKERIKRLNELRKRENEDMETEEYDDASALAPGSDSKKRKRSGPSEEDLANAQARSEAFAAKEKEAAEAEGELNDGIKSLGQSGKKRMYMKELRNVVDAADVVLLVLDARDPMGCRAPQAERMVLESAHNKRLVIVLNKIDLVPKVVVERWLTELRKEFPTVAFRASTQEQKSNLGRASKDSIALGTSSTADRSATIGDSICVGADTLLQLLKNYSRNRDIKTSITVGVVGYPNVGKSSVINSLKRSRAVGVSPTPGFTKALQIVQLDKKVKLIDSPGVLFQDSNQSKDSTRLVLRNCLNPADLEDPVTHVSKLVEKCNPEHLMMLYRCARFSTPVDFLVSIATKRGKLTKGGVPDQSQAARIVLQDWNAGRIPYYVLPPKPDAVEQKAIRGNAKIVSAWSKEFDLEALLSKNQDDLVEKLPSSNPDEYAAIFAASVKL